LKQSQIRPRNAAVLICVLLAFVWHSTIVQSHVHYRAAGQFAAGLAQLTTPAEPDYTKAEVGAKDCPLCKEAGLSGAYLLPVLIVLQVIANDYPGQTFAAFREVDRSARSHLWRSRAPPSVPVLQP